MDIPTDYLSRITRNSSKAEVHQYSDLCNRAAKMVGHPYFVMHSRISQAFKTETADVVISYLERWLQEASKSDNPGLVINSKLKQFREQVC